MKPNLTIRIPSIIAQWSKAAATGNTGVLMVALTLILAPLPRANANESSPLAGAAVLGDVDLLQRYPTKLTAGDTRPDQARSWEFTDADVFRVSRFHLEGGKTLRIDVGSADLGIGHCADGAVWAVLIPQQSGELTFSTNREEAIAHVWLRFHPEEIARVFPPETVSAGGATNLLAQMRAIANAKMTSSWQAGGRAMIPEPKDLTVDVDTKDGPRRFFSVDTAAHTAQYWAAFENGLVKLPPAITTALAETTFDQLWEAFDQKYAMFVLRPEVDWAKLREQYRPKALASKSTYEFAEVCADMLKNLRDLHIWLTVAGADMPVFNRPRSANANPQACRAILGDLKREGRVVWAVTTNNIGYIAIYGWNDSKIPTECGEALEQMRDTRGLIVDVRLNGGGGEPLAGQFAGRFLEKEFVYAYSQFRNGPSHTNLTEKYERKVAPRGPWRYNRPVLLLIGQKCMSSNESFIGMMTGDPEVTTMGDHTCGSSGNPEIVRLPLDLTVSVPQWIDYLPDGTPLDERGFQPQIPFQPAPGAFEGNRDDLLGAAIARLSQMSLPDKPIPGPVFEPETSQLPDHSRDVQEEARDPSRPKVVSVMPTNGALSVASVTEIHVRFDRPMDPLSLKLDWESGGFLDCEFPKYDPDKYEFAIPVHLAPGALQQVVVNNPGRGDENLGDQRKHRPRDGFQSVDHRLAGLFVWRFRTQGTPSPARSTPPQVTTISPAPGSQVPFRTFLEIQFDQPMTPPAEAFPYLVSKAGSNEPRMISRVQYDVARHAFRIPLLLAPNEKTEFTLTGFRSVAGVPARPVNLQYQVSDEELAKADREKIEAGTAEPRLLDLLETMKQKRMQLTSLSERVQDLTLSQKDGLFYELRSQSATFKWQKPDQYYGDATGPMLMCNDFRIGSDGQHWWWHNESARWTLFIVCPVAEMHELNVSICDPFDLTHMTPTAAATKLGLNYAGVCKVVAADCLQVEAWQIVRLSKAAPFGSLIQWWIDPRNYRPAQITLFGSGYVSRTRFLYDRVNESLPAGDFAVPKLEGLSPTPPETLGQGYTNRFINLRDGSDGRMSVRWGKKGPEGTSSSGLN
jgi:Peptidase family S41/Tricorn protease C1 domain